jgi:large subunit ribosomal protein L5
MPFPVIRRALEAFPASTGFVNAFGQIRGLSPRKFDGRGNYTFGVGDQTIFPEIEMDKIKRTQGMDITIVTNARNNDAAQELLKLLGFPFSEK